MEETKLCKHCKTEIPKKAKVCPNCRKKQGSKLGIILIVLAVIICFVAISGSGDDTDKVKKTGEISSSEKKESGNSKEEKSNVFKAGDIVETEDFEIKFISAKKYKSDNDFIQPKKGYEYWEFRFEFKNISDSDQTVSSLMDWECYADNTKADQTYIGDDNGLDATLSKGRSTKGTLYFEIPKNSKSIELEYDISYWGNDKIVFVGK